MESQPSAADSKSKSSRMVGGALYVVATPIGNLGDMTYRAVEVLKAVQAIACEDTRVTRKLLQHFDIHTPSFSYNDHNGAQVRPKLIAKLQAGEMIALVSDAGTPLISDPGYKLVSELRSLHIPVISIPGASSVTAALSVCGLPTDQFHFAGFLPSKAQARASAIARLAQMDGSLVLLESPRRLDACLPALLAGLGNREVVLAREITKLHEEIKSGMLADLAAHYATAPAPKGELVIVIAPAEKSAPAADDIDALLRAALAQYPVKEAAAQVAAQTGLGRSELYQRALALKS